MFASMNINSSVKSGAFRDNRHRRALRTSSTDRLGMSRTPEQDIRQFFALVAYLRELIAALEADWTVGVDDAALVQILIRMKLDLDDATLKLSLLREQRA